MVSFFAFLFSLVFFSFFPLIFISFFYHIYFFLFFPFLYSFTFCSCLSFHFLFLSFFSFLFHSHYAMRLIAKVWLSALKNTYQTPTFTSTLTLPGPRAAITMEGKRVLYSPHSGVQSPLYHPAIMPVNISAEFSEHRPVLFPQSATPLVDDKGQWDRAMKGVKNSVVWVPFPPHCRGWGLDLRIIRPKNSEELEDLSE